LILVGALATFGCKPKEEPAPPAPAPSVTAPVDRLAAGEIPEGRERAFTLPLPLHSTVKARFPGSVHVASTHSYDELVKFVAAHVTEGSIEKHAAESRFDKVIVKTDPSKRLSIDVRRALINADYETQLVVTDITPAPEPPGMTDTDRWKKAGLTPEGKPLDPKTLQ
jgi:hypothetical protein